MNLLSLAILWSAAYSGGPAESPDDLIRSVRVSNRSAVEAVTSLSCRYTKTSTRADGQTRQIPPGEYSRSAGMVRIRSRSGQRWSDTLVRDGRMVSMSNSPDPKHPEHVVGSVRPYGGQPLGHCDPLYDGLFTLLGDIDKPPCNMTFDDYLRRPYKVLHAERVTDGGREHVVIRLEFVPDSWTEYHFDPKANYLMSRLKYYFLNKSVRPPTSAEGETEVIRFREASPGVYFPEEVVKKEVTAGQLVGTHRIVFQNIRLNQPLSQDAFNLRFPEGTEVDDLIQGRRYRTGSDGNQKGEAQPVPLPPPPRELAEYHAGTETSEEPSSWTVWLTPASLGVLGIASGTWAVRRWRVRRGV